MEGEHITMEVWCLKYFASAGSPDEQSAFGGLLKIIICSFISFWSLQLNEFQQSEIKLKLSSVQKITCIIAISDKKIISAFCASGVLCSPSLSAIQIKEF